MPQSSVQGYGYSEASSEYMGSHVEGNLADKDPILAYLLVSRFSGGSSIV